MTRALEPTIIPRQGLETPHGTLYPPLPAGRQLLVVLLAFLASLGSGGLIALIPGDLSSSARVVLHLPYVLVFVTGYALWVARLSAIAFDGIGRSVLRALWQYIVHRRAPRSMEEVLPSRERLVEMAVRAQLAGRSFFTASWPIAIVGALCVCAFETHMSSFALAAMVGVTTLAWGAVLARAARRGWLPLPEEE